MREANIKDGRLDEYGAQKKKWERITTRKIISRYFGVPRCKGSAYYLHLHSTFSYFGHGGTDYADWIAIPEFRDSVEALSFLRFWMIPHLLNYEVNNVGKDELMRIDTYFSDFTQGEEHGIKVKALLDAMDLAIGSQSSSEATERIYSQINRTFGELDPSLLIIASGGLFDIVSSRHEHVEHVTCLRDAMVQYVEAGSGSAEKLKAVLDSASFDIRNREHVTLTNNFIMEYLGHNQLAPPWYL